MEGVVRIRLRAMAGTRNNLEGLRSLTGYNLIREGNDYVVYEGDPKFEEGRPEFLMLSEKVDIRSSGWEDKIVNALMQAPPIPASVQMPRNIGVVDDMGFFSRLDKARQALFFSSSQELGKVLKENVFPFAEEINSYEVRVAWTDVRKFYSRVALAKLSYFVSQFGIEDAEKWIFERRVFDSVLPNVFEPQELLQVFLIFPPYVIAYSLGRPNAMTIFVPKKLRGYDYRCFKTLPDHLAVDMNYLQSKGEPALMTEALSARDMAQVIDVMAMAVNKFWDFFTRPKFWLNKYGVFDELTSIKAMALGKLLVADVSAIQRTSMSFARNRLMFEFFDKLAQLLVERHGVFERRDRMESRWAAHLLDDSMLELLCSILSHHYKKTRHRAFLTFSKFAAAVRSNVERDLLAIHARAGVKITSKSQGECIRTIRNLAHGTFLARSSFEKQFLKVSPEVPVDAHRVPWLYLLAFALDPHYFIQRAIPILDKME